MTDTGSHQTDIINQYHQENNELRESLRRKTKDCEAAVVELKRVQEQSLAWFQDSANKDAQLKELEAALASSQAHHAYDNERHAAAWHKLEVRLSAVHGNIPPRPICASHSMISAEHQHNLWDSVVEMDSAWDEMTKALAPSTPAEKPLKMKAVDKRRSIAVKWTHGMATEVKCRCGRTGIVVFCMGADALSKQFKVKVLEPRP